jgi:transposase
MKTYDKDFKINTVNLYRNSNRSIKVIAREMGIATSTLSKWTRIYSEQGEKSFPGKGTPKTHEEELRALRKELIHVRQERDILKNHLKALPFPV